jgi:pimeloyl-ACP methyl ester carboxylesterase
MNPVEASITLAWGTLTGLHWSRPGAARVLCLHGWLDNAASFVPMATFLDEFDLLALDFAGHGLSSHRPADSRYHATENLFDLDQVLDKLGWESCHLIGHSLGGGIASCFAAALPERVDSLVMLDAVGILSLPAGQAARRLRMSVQSVRKQLSNLRPYTNVEEAIRARQGKSPLSDHAARLLCERSLEHTGDHYQWRTDPRLNWRSPQWFSDNQVLDVLAAIRSPTLVFTSPSVIDYLGEPALNQRLSAIADCRRVKEDGHHHFHMDKAQKTAAIVKEFFIRES